MVQRDVPVAFHIAIPARHASTRFPGKPLAEVGGRTVLEHVWNRALAAGAVSAVIATDDRRIATVAEGFGASVCLTRDDHASGTDRLGELADLRGWADDEIVVNLQGDEPLTPPDLLAQVAADLAAWPDASMATLATSLGTDEDPASPDVVKVVTDARGFAMYFSRAAIPHQRVSGGVRVPPLRHLGIYAYRAGFLRTFGDLPPAPPEQAECLEQLRSLWHGYRIHVGIATSLPGPGVDTPADLERVARRLAAEGECDA